MGISLLTYFKKLLVCETSLTIQNDGAFSTNLKIVIIPPQNAVLGGILFSVCPKFRDSVHISRFLMYNFSSFRTILFKFSTHFNHQTMHVL